MPPSSNPPRPSGRIRWLRIFGLLAMWLVWVAGILFGVSHMLLHSELVGILLVPLTVLVGLPTILGFFSVAAFPLPYSVIGKLARTPLPPESTALDVVRCSWIQVGGLFSTIPTVTWTIYPTGLGIKIFMIGQVFLPRKLICSLNRNTKGQCVISHACAEIRSPIYGPGWLCELMDAQWKEKQGE